MRISAALRLRTRLHKAAATGYDLGLLLLVTSRGLVCIARPCYLSPGLLGHFEFRTLVSKPLRRFVARHLRLVPAHPDQTTSTMFAGNTRKAN
jgi:hypothetical protein